MRGARRVVPRQKHLFCRLMDECEALGELSLVTAAAVYVDPFSGLNKVGRGI